MKVSGILRPVAFLLLIILAGSNLSSSQPLKITGTSDLSRIYDDGFLFPVNHDTVKMFGIRGEIISGQIAIKALKKISDVTTEVTLLVHSVSGVSIPSSNIEWNFVGSVLLLSNAPNQPKDVVERAAPAKFPDFLMQERKINIDKGKFQSLWLNVKLPEDAIAGTYHGTIRVNSAKGSQAIPLQVIIYPLTMPSGRHLKIAVRYSVNDFDKYHGIPEKYSDNWFEMLRKYAENMVEHHQNVMQAPLNTIEISRSGGGELMFDFTRFDQIVGVFLNTGKMDFIETGYGLTKFGKGEWFSTEILLSDFSVKDAGSGNVVNLPGEYVVPLFLPAFERHLRQKGWIGKTLLSVRNEPSVHNAQIYGELSDYFHRLAPDLKQFESIETTMYGGLDIPGPKLDHLATWYDKYREDQEKGVELCYYIVGIYQGSRYPNKTIDLPLMNSRIMPWLNYKYDLSGIKHWGWNSWTDDPYKEVGQHLGDGWHVYPVKDGVLNSLRWEEMRNGIQDYEYLWLLESKIKALKDSLGSRFSWIDPKQRGKEIVGEVVKSFADFTSDPDILYLTKMKIINELLEFDTSPKLYVQTNPFEKSTLTNHSSVEVFGWAEPGTRIIINGAEIPVSRDGLFLEQFGGEFIDPSKIRLGDSITVQAVSAVGTKKIVRNFNIIY